ncbi:uroporphyrinogen-III synthase [Superficieibacter electus]|uniref:Uroporphyrinogen-III synthase n=1 Tax=Superficieibacter electus TaxID=2022662 RepID=A0A2P5GL84_9ENTR|nr:uroporphyrinogen-III synthase [Superficieibacter electus]POP42667.1 uroporphyrinogen-III synthase [Superficieibacter electus]POP45743.1 uroporphyrinogen-III synthase [Superficieibacter electus]
MSILVTRPAPQGEELVRRLCARGLVAWNFPLIEFMPGRELPMLSARLAALNTDDLVFALSRHAVEFAHAQLQRQGASWPCAPRYFAIGRSTALALHTVSGYDIRYPQDREISEVLLQLPELQNVAGRRALVLRGNGGRELLGETLTARGADVIFCECYQRSAKHYDGAEEAMRWHARGVTTLVVTSGEMLQQLWSLIPQWYREHWLLRCRLLVVSERLAYLARDLGWQDIQVADNADNDALLRALQ